MYQLSEPAIKAILKAWHPQKYRPPFTDVEKWIDSIESLCNEYGIPDGQRLRCAVNFVKEGLRQALLEVGEKFGAVNWNQFKLLLVAFDEDFRDSWRKLPFWKRHPKYTGAAIIVGGTVLTPAVGYSLVYAGWTSFGFAAVTYESILYGSATRLLVLPALQSAGSAATMVPTVGAALTGATTTGAGLLVAATNGQPDNSTNGNHLKQAVERITKPESDGNPPQDSATTLEAYLFTPLAILAIVKAWDVETYDPPKTDCAKWLDRVHNVCEQYEIPAKQRASCASHHMRADCKEAVHSAGCYNMRWDEFAGWLRLYDDVEGKRPAKALT